MGQLSLPLMDIRTTAYGATSPFARVPAKDGCLPICNILLTLGNGGNGVNCPQASLEAAGHHPEQAGLGAG